MVSQGVALGCHRVDPSGLKIISFLLKRSPLSLRARSVLKNTTGCSGLNRRTQSTRRRGNHEQPLCFLRDLLFQKNNAECCRQVRKRGGQATASQPVDSSFPGRCPGNATVATFCVSVAEGPGQRSGSSQLLAEILSTIRGTSAQRLVPEPS